MSLHIAARDGEIADRILLPGDPLRAKYIAETFLDDAVCYTDIRNILGYTGTYKGVRLSVQGTGMGIPSISIYATELMRDYGVKKLIGAYAAAMGGVDAIIFTAGVGENSASQRLDIASGLEFMGVKMDAEANNVRGKETVISAADSKVKVLLIPTNEELMIAMDTASIVKG